MANKSIQTSKDALWKGIIHDLFDDFMGFYFPEYIHLIDFGQKVIFLDKELAELSPPCGFGR